MKLVGELKKEVEKIETKEGKKEVIMKAGMELSDEELDQVTGGAFKISGNSVIRLPKECTCENPDWHTDINGVTYCRNCNPVVL